MKSHPNYQAFPVPQGGSQGITTRMYLIGQALCGIFGNQHIFLNHYNEDEMIGMVIDTVDQLLERLEREENEPTTL